MADSSAGSLRAPDRLSALHLLGLLDTPSEEAFDRLTRTAAAALRAPIALVTLIEEDRQFFKSCVGLPEPFAARESPLLHSFCQHVVASGEPLAIEDAGAHPLVRDNPAVSDLSVLAYAGAPLRVRSGDVIGALCVVDTQRRQWTEQEIQTLADLAATVVREIEWRESREIEAQYRALGETASDGIVAIDQDSTILFVNPAVERIFGYSEDELIGKALSVLIPERFREAHAAGIRRYLQTGQRTIPWKGIELPGRTRTGAEIPLEISFGEYLWGGNRVFTGIVRDIGERHRPAEAVRLSEQRFHSLVAATAQIVWTTTPDGMLVGEQPDWSAFTGQTLEEYQGWGWLEAIHPEDRAHTSDAWSTAVANRSHYEVSHRVRSHDGEYRYFSVHGVAVLEADGSIREWVGTHTDITTRKRAEEERQFLMNASEVLASSLDYERTLASIAHLAVERLADWCAVDIVEDGHIRRVVTAHRNPAREELATQLQRYPLAPDAPGAAPQVIRTGEPLLYPEIPDVLLEALARNAEHLELLRNLGLLSGVVVPMRSRDSIIGAITLVAAESGRRYGPGDLELAEDLARRAAVAVDNARLLRQTEEAREVTEYQAAELEAQVEELQNQAMQLEENQAELEIANTDLEQANAALLARTEEAEQARAETERGNAALRSQIEQRARVEERLRTSERSYRSLWDSLTDLVYILDLDGHILTVNDAVLHRYGYAPEEILGSTPALLAAPGLMDLERTQIQIQSAIEGEPQRFEFWARTRDGEVFPQEVVLTRGEYFGAPVVIAVGRDISERKAAEAERKAAEIHYRRLVENAPYAVYALDREGRFTELNQASVEILGRDPAELIGRSIAEVVAPEDLPKAVESLRQKLAGEVETSDLEIRLVHASGEYRLVHLRATVIREGGEIVGTHGVAWDMTEERARQEQMRLLTTALEGLNEGVSVARFDGQLIYANSTHARLLGYDRRGGGLPNSALFIPDETEAQRVEEIFREVAAHGTWSGRVRHRRVDDGRIVPLELIVGRVDREDAESVVFNIARDITEELQKEQQLRRVERLASLGTLIGGVAHELNNPLHAIRSFAELLLMEERDGGDREALEIIQREADRAGKVVSDLRLIARETQDEEGTREAVDLNDVIRHVLKVRRYALETSNVEIREDLVPGLPPVLANRGEIEQVVLNLVVNAQQAMQEQNEHRLLILRTRRTPDGATVHIVDSGPGIDPRHLERIFDPFFTTKPPGEGTGLGLSLVHGIITEHGGEIHVDSELGKGTAFRIDLPRAPFEGAAQEDIVPPAPARSLRILVVDDEDAVRRVSVRFLERLGHHVDAAAEGDEALRLLKDAEYDAIVSDLRMPGLGGEELLQRLTARHEGLDRKLIFVTGDAASAQAARVVADANVPVLIKPLRLDQLASAIELVANAPAPKPEEER